MSTTRREFLTTTATVAAGAAVLGSMPVKGLGQATTPADAPLWEIPELKTPESTKEGEMLYRKLGKTGEKVSLIGLGGAHGFRGTDATLGTRILRKAVDAGINFMDNCWDYGNGNAEIGMGKALADGYRKKVFLMTKLDSRSHAGTMKQLDDCLKRLQTDVIDLMQIHEIIRMEDEKCFDKGGTMDALKEAKKAGKIRYIGFTGHKSPEIHMHFIEVAKKHDFVFDSVQMPLNVLDAHFKSFARVVVPRLVKDGTGVLAMKTLASGAITRGNVATGEECLHYAMNLPTSVVIVGMDTEARVDQALEAVKKFKPLEQKVLADLLAKTRARALDGALETFKTTLSFDGTTRNPTWMD